MKRMGRTRGFFAALAVLLMSPWGYGQTTQTGLHTLGIAEVKVTPTLGESVDKAGKITSLGRVAEAMDGQLLAAFHATRKFKLVSRSDLNELLKEQGFGASGNCDFGDPLVAKALKVRGIKYVVVLTINDFQDQKEEMTFAGLGEKSSRRTTRLSAVAGIYDTTTGEVLSAPNFQLKNSSKPNDQSLAVKSDGDLSDALLIQTARDMAEKITNRVADEIYPARVLAVTDKQVTINRGDGTGIASNQIWIVHALGQEMFDPDTKESLGREELRAGKVRISSVQPKFAKAEIIEGTGVKAGDLLRLDDSRPPATQP